MAKEKYSRKALMALSIIAVLSQLLVSPVLCKAEKKLPFEASFSGYVTNAEPLPPYHDIMDRLQRYYLETAGSIDASSMPGLSGASVTIRENYQFHIPEGNGLSVGSFTVSTLVGDIYVSFTAEVTGLYFFNGVYRIVGGTGLFEKVRGYGTIEGSALGPPMIGVEVIGSVDGYIWGLPD